MTHEKAEKAQVAEVGPQTERTALDALSRRYATKVTNGRWVGQKFMRAEHVPIGLRGSRWRICDFVAVSMHSTPHVLGQRSAMPPIYHGHEVKVSRSDWLRELADPGKAETFNQYMHYWWLVATPGVVKDDLPEDWGLMVLHASGRLVKVVDAPLTVPERMPEDLHGALLRAAVTTERRIASRPGDPA